MMGRWILGLLLAQGPLILNEFMPRPADAEGEWVEVFHAGSEAVPLNTVWFGDATGKTYALGESGTIAPGEYLVLAQRPDSLRRAFALDPAVRVIRPAGWPILNDRDGDEGYAEVLVLRGPGESLHDSLAYSEGWLSPVPGVSVERGGAALPSTASGSWGWSLNSRGGTPGAPNSLELQPDPVPPGALFTGPHTVAPGRAPARFAYALPGPGRLSFWLVDRSGRYRQILKEPDWSSPQGQFLWSGDPQPDFDGPCFVCLFWSDATRVVRRCRPVWVQ